MSAAWRWTKLEKIDPRVYQFLLSFAKDNDLRVVDCRIADRRSLPEPVLG